MADVKTAIEPLEEVSDDDLEDLCDAAESAILDGGGFGWLKPPPRAVLGRYFRGVVLVPERHLFCLLYTSPSPRDVEESRMPSSA